MNEDVFARMRDHFYCVVRETHGPVVGGMGVKFDAPPNHLSPVVQEEMRRIHDRIARRIVREHFGRIERIHERRYQRDANYIARIGLQQSFERRGA